MNAMFEGAVKREEMTGGSGVSAREGATVRWPMRLTGGVRVEVREGLCAG